MNDKFNPRINEYVISIKEDGNYKLFKVIKIENSFYYDKDGYKSHINNIKCIYNGSNVKNNNFTFEIVNKEENEWMLY